MNQYFPEGHLLHTKENKEAIGSLTKLERAKEKGIILEGIAVLCDSHFSLHVELENGLVGIIPREEVQFAEEPVKDIAILTRVGKPVCFKVMDFTENDDGKTVIVLSRREAQKECFENFIYLKRPGDILPAKSTHLEPFGAFMDVGCGIPSLLTVDCISVSRIAHPGERIALGETVPCIVKSIDSQGRLYLTRKELLGTWEENASLFSVGQTVAGIVRSIESYGIFIELTPNLAGLAEKKEDVEVGETAAVFIKNIIPEKMKVKLVIIDSSARKLVRQPSLVTVEPPLSRHMDYWRYSPLDCSKVIETIFA